MSTGSGGVAMMQAAVLEGSDDRLAEDWKLIEGLLPDRWEDKARELGAFRRGREIPTPSILLRVLLIHLAQGCGLRETAVRAQCGGLANVSDVAILKRLKSCGAWFEWMAGGLRQKWLPDFPIDAPWGAHNVRLVDGTVVSEPGDTGSQWRLHYSIGLPALNCDEVVMTTTKEGETLKRFTVHGGDLFIGDRGYAHPAGIAHVVAGKADVIIRTNLVTLPLYDEGGQRLSVLHRLRRLEVGEHGHWLAQVKSDKRWIAGRLCAVKKSEAAAQKARSRVMRESQRNGTQVQPETLEAASYVFVFTTLPKSCPASTVMELYRGRWQIELAFNRLKSLLQLGHLKKHDETAARAWQQGKLLVAFLLDALLLSAERTSPWGYATPTRQPQSMPVAGDSAEYAACRRLGGLPFVPSQLPFVGWRDQLLVARVSLLSVKFLTPHKMGKIQCAPTRNRMSGEPVCKGRHMSAWRAGRDAPGAGMSKASR